MDDFFDIKSVFMEAEDASKKTELYCMVKHQELYEDWEIKILWLRHTEYSPDGEIKRKQDTRTCPDFDGYEIATNYYEKIIEALKNRNYVYEGNDYIIE